MAARHGEALVKHDNFVSLNEPNLYVGFEDYCSLVYFIPQYAVPFVRLDVYIYSNTSRLTRAHEKVLRECG